VPPQTCRPALDSDKRPNGSQKPSFSPRFSVNLRHLSWERGKNSRKTREKSSKNGAKWRFFEGKSAISTVVYENGIEAQTNGVPGLTSASPAALSDRQTANSKTERHFRRVECRDDPRAVGHGITKGAGDFARRQPYDAIGAGDFV
jgi:hypothetical protein